MEQKYCYGCMREITEAVCPHCGWDSRQENLPHQLPVGTVLAENFLVGRVLGQGGFGITYIGRDLNLDTVVAIKEYYPTAIVNRDSEKSYQVSLNTTDVNGHYSDGRDRFVREARALARLQNIPEVVSVRSLFQENNTAYIVMEYAKGIDLRNYVRENGGRIPADLLLPMLEPVLRALDKVHKAGLVHRDVSPDNIMILPNGGTKLLDFGAVRAVDKMDSDIDLSHSTEAILKHGFAPMEQYRSRGNLGPWTDEYGVCASIYYCLTGKVPPDAPSRAMGEEDVDWSQVPGLKDIQRAALKKGMSLRAKDRFGDMEALRCAIYEETAEIQVLPEGPRTQAEHRSMGKKKSGGGWVAAVLLLILLIGVGVFLYANPVIWNSGMEKLQELFSEEIILEKPAEIQVPTYERSEEPLPEETVSPETAAPRQEETEPGEFEDSVITVSEDNGEWRENLMVSNPMQTIASLGVPLDYITKVTFQDSLEDAPVNTMDVSADHDGSVLAWGISDGFYYHVFFAADGGMNGKNCCAGMFSKCVRLKEVSFSGAFHTEESQNMSRMFQGCRDLAKVDAQNLDTRNVKDMSYMFQMLTPGTDPSRLGIGDSREPEHGLEMYQYNAVLTELDVSAWDVSNVVDMSYMFCGCRGIRKLDVSRWDVSKVVSMEYMLSDTSLNSFDANSWKLNTDNAVSMSHMFYGCDKLLTVEIADWDVSGVTDMSAMFLQCETLQNCDLSKWNLSGVTNMNQMFRQCKNLVDLNVSEWNLSNVQSMRELFSGCVKVKELDVSKWDLSSVTDMAYSFHKCSQVTVLDVSQWNVSAVRDMSYAFTSTKVSQMDVGGWDVSNVRNMEGMFLYCTKLKNLDLKNWKTHNELNYKDFCSKDTMINDYQWQYYFWNR